MKKLQILAIAFLLSVAPVKADTDLCSNLDGIQTEMPAGYSTIGAVPAGSCYVIPPPVTIDVNPAGSGVDAVTIDVNPVGSGVPAVQIDVNPVSGSASPAVITATVSSTTMSTTTPTLITSIEALQPYIFSPEATNEEKIQAIENHIKSLLLKMIETLLAEIEALKTQQ